MAGRSARAGERPGWAPPLGTNQRIRNRAIWAVALFAASMLPAFFGVGIVPAASETVDVAVLFVSVFWIVGVSMALWAAFPTLRYWEGLPAQTRWLGALPMLTISLFLSTALLALIFT